MPTSVFSLSEEETSKVLCVRIEHGIACCVLYPHYPGLSGSREDLDLCTAVGFSTHTVWALFPSGIGRCRGVIEGTPPGKRTCVLLPFKASSPSLTPDEADGLSLLRGQQRFKGKFFLWGPPLITVNGVGHPTERVVRAELCALMCGV